MTRCAPIAGLWLAALPLAARDAFPAVARPVLAKYCVTCHDATQKMGGLNLDAFRDGVFAAALPGIRSRIHEKIASGKMPPAGSPRPGPEQTAALMKWIEGVGGVAIRSGAPTARATLRRLNRAEYDNTIRDLLGVPGKHASGFPLDDSGYGFDNIAAVLSISPMLMEKYLDAARKIARLAVHGEALPARPSTLGHYLGKHSHDSRRALAAPGVTPFSLRGSIYATHLFPWDAEYEFRFRVVNFRYILTRRGEPRPTPEQIRKLFPTVDAVLTLDGAPVKVAPVEGNLAMEFDRGDIVARARVRAGEHLVRVSFPHLADIDDPRDNVNPDQRRKLRFDYLDIVGPFDPSPERPTSYRRLFVCGHPPGRHVPA